MFKEQDNVYNGEGLPSLHDDSPVDKSASCCGRLCAELNPCGHAIFSVIDPATKRTIDIPASFAPDSGRYHGTLLVKLFLFALGWATFGYGMSVGAVPGFYFAYLTNWGVIWCSLYLTLSLINTMLSSTTTQPASNEKISWRITLTWITFVLGIHSTTIASLNYWPLVFEPGTTTIYFSTIMAHAILFFILTIDGMIINRIPIRISHWFCIIFPWNMTYLIWTIIHSVAHIGNPDENDNDPETNDDAIYGVLVWNDERNTAIFWTFVIVFVIGPVAFLFLWCLSSFMLCCRDRLRYI